MIVSRQHSPTVIRRTETPPKRAVTSTCMGQNVPFLSFLTPVPVHTVSLVLVTPRKPQVVSSSANLDKSFPVVHAFRALRSHRKRGLNYTKRFGLCSVKWVRPSQRLEHCKLHIHTVLLRVRATPLMCIVSYNKDT